MPRRHWFVCYSRVIPRRCSKLFLAIFVLVFVLFAVRLKVMSDGLDRKRILHQMVMAPGPDQPDILDRATSETLKHEPEAPLTKSGVGAGDAVKLDVAKQPSNEVQQDAINHTEQTNKCAEKHNIVFIKGMKSATSTMLGLLYKFGISRNLSFVLPLDNKLYLNWPFPLTQRDCRPSSRGYNILTDHSIYTESVMEAIMPKDTVYVGIVRQPLEHLRSVFKYFKLPEISGVSPESANPITEYLTHVEAYERAYKSPTAKNRNCIPDGFSMTKNLMSHCHGMPVGFPPGTPDISNDTVAVKDYIHYLDKKFSLIMIVEHFYESLLLLKRLMCWQHKDIVFISSNVAKHEVNLTQVPESARAIHKGWSAADYALYDFFLKRLLERVLNEGPGFYQELEVFKKVEQRVKAFCDLVYAGKGGKELAVEGSEWSEAFVISDQYCKDVFPNPYSMMANKQKENDVKEHVLLEQQKKFPDNRTLKGLC